MLVFIVTTLLKGVCMRKHLVFLVLLSVLFSGCASAPYVTPVIPNTNVEGYDLPKDFIYPASDNPFVKDAFARHKLDSQKDFTALFTAPAPTNVTTCGIPPDVLREWFIQNDEELKKMGKQADKAILRGIGIESSHNFANVDPDFQIMASTCSTPGMPGIVTARFKASTITKSAANTTEMRQLNVGIMSFSKDLQPTYLTLLTKHEFAYTFNNPDGTQKVLPVVKPPVMIFYSDRPVKELSISLSFAKSGDEDFIMLSEPLGKNRIKSTEWFDGTLSGYSYTKNLRLHGELVKFTRMAKVPGSSRKVELPGTRNCFQNGLEIKTTGPCIVD
jgi:hypothetical protein